ncbi:branched-chain amino acid ABC transporter permease [Aeromicrobium piscarium]|uniref:branched-chain amino acid ABC transporter permease n=1 Tax=Aeromicrobium piscarium TaxID=2590901 RepID=UPI00163D58BC|nr:branched-chain amino acid ABC transporter permease [Aeromicrobium piscarium]
MITFLEFILTGAIAGTVYGLTALPMSLVHSTTHAVDSAVGGYVVVAGFIAATIGGIVGSIAAIIAATGLSLLSYGLYILLRRRGPVNPITYVLLTFGLLTVLESFILWWRGPDGIVRSLFSGEIQVAGMSVSPQALVNLLVGAAVVGSLLFVIYRTPAGLWLRASASNVKGANLAGLAVDRLWASVFIVQGAVAGLAGVLLLNTAGMSYQSAAHLTLMAIAAAMIFGFRGPTTAFCGGLVLGVVESVAIGYVSGAIATALPFIIILAALMIGSRNVAVRA